MTELVYVEIGSRYSYAGALEWPGWCRHATRSKDPIDELLAYGPRYRDSLAASGIAFEPPDDAAGLRIVERVEGNSGTEFGVPSVILADDQRSLSVDEVERLGTIVTACWDAYDRAAQAARGRQLRKGPRGGGRDLAGLIAHMIESDVAYLSKLGARQPGDGRPGSPERWLAIRARALDTLRSRALDRPVAEASRTREPWLPRYYVRRAGWHAMHHAWEIEDRLEPLSDA